MKTNQKIKKLVLLSLLIAIEVIFIMTPLGFIPLGSIRATTLHIPVILAGILLGYKGGITLGLVFGISSIIINTLTPTPLSFLFSPFYSLGNISGGIGSVIIAIVPRVMIGVVASFSFNLLKKRKLGLCLSAFLASITNTFLVLLGIIVFFFESYAQIKSITSSAVAFAIFGQLGFNGILEAIVAVIIVSFTGSILLKMHNIERG